MPEPLERAEVIRRVGRLAHDITDRAVWVGIDGLGASGKSTLAAAIATAVPRAVVVNTDDFQGVGIAEWDWPRLLRDVVRPLRSGKSARYEERRWGEASGRGSRSVPPNAVVIVEGVSATRREVDVPWDLTVWVEAPDTVRRERALRRDGAAAEPTWREHWWPSEQRYVAREQPMSRVDVVVSGTAG